MTPREQLAQALQQARIDAGYGSRGAFTKVLRASRSVISRAENPREAVPSNDVVTRWAAATKADKAKLLEYAKRARNPRSFFAKWSDDFEQRATLIRWHEPLLVPGLIQTERYMRAVLGWKPFSADVDHNLSERLARQSVLDRAELRVLILGSVISREVGDASVMYEQIAHLVELGERSSVVLQIVPDTSVIAGALGGAFAIATEGAADTAVFTDSTVQSSVYTDNDALARAVRVWDGLHANALPWIQTREQLVQAGERWKQQMD
jgi:hypothetical protein